MITNSLMAEASFGKYRLIAELGHGGMADVFLAVQAGPLGSGFSKLTVVKRLRANLAEQPEFISMLVDEARIAARLNHPNVVQTNEIDEVDERYFIAMEYLDGQPFHRIQHRAAKADAPAQLTKEMQYLVLMDVLAGLHHAHELTDYDGTKLNIVHRDVTPHNVFVTYEGQVKVVDFGIAKASGRASETRQGVVKGKVRYMAPEQALGRELDRRADIFAAGVILWEIAAGRRMWKELDEVQVLQALIAGEVPRSPKAFDATVPDAIDAICQKALGRVEERFETAEQMREAIEQYLTDANEIVQARRKLPHVVCELFKDKRAEIRAIIESQLAMLHTRPAVELRTLPAPDSMASGATPFSLTPPSRRHGSGTMPPSAPSSGGTPPPVAVDEAHRSGLTGRPTSLHPGSAPSMPIESTELSVDRPRRPRRSLAALAGVGVVGVLLATAIGMAWNNGRASVADVTGPLPATSALPAEATEVGLRVTATPADALVWVDGASPQRLPLDIKVPKDAREHQLRFEAAGHVSKTETVTFAHDVTLAVVLDKTSAPAVHKAKTGSKAVTVAAAWSPPKNGDAAAPKSATPPPPATFESAPMVPPPAPERRGSSRLGLDKSDPWSGK